MPYRGKFDMKKMMQKNKKIPAEKRYLAAVIFLFSFFGKVALTGEKYEPYQKYQEGASRAKLNF